MPPHVILQWPQEVEANKQVFKTFKSFSHQWSFAIDAKWELWTQVWQAQPHQNWVSLANESSLGGDLLKA